LSRGKKGSHSPTLFRLVARTLDEECTLLPGLRLLLAVSGGTDSTALLHVMHRLADERGLVLHAHGVDHGLRAESMGELDQAQSFAERLNIPFSRSSVVLGKGSNLQARARALRYEALRKRATELGGCRIVTAHHANDRAETVLLRILRGTGLGGLGVLAAQEGDLLRPLLRAKRSDILLHLARHELPFATDPSNGNPKYTRVRVRKEVLPLLEQINPNIVEHLCSIADDAIALRSSDGDALPSLGRQQRLAIERAIKRRNVGFELLLATGLRLSLRSNMDG